MVIAKASGETAPAAPTRSPRLARRHGFVARRLQQLCEAATDGQLGNYLWVVRALDPEAMALEWGQVRRRALDILSKSS